MHKPKKSDFIHHLLKTIPSLTKGQAEQAYKAIFDFTVLTLKEGGTVKIPNLGTFTVATRKPTTYRNPQTQDLINKGPQQRIKFIMSDTMKASLNIHDSSDVTIVEKTSPIDAN